MIETASALWKAASQREGTEQSVRRWRLRIAELDIELNFANQSMETVYQPAIGHLKVEALPGEAAAEAKIRLYLWDAAGTPLPPPPEGLKQLGPHGQIPGLPAGQSATFQGGSGVWSLFDAQSGSGYVAARDAATLPNYELAAPMRALLGWVGATMGETNGFALTHAAAIGIPGGAALLVGRGGSGKSTTALSCFLSGLLFLGDDYVALRTPHASEPIEVWSLYQSAKVSAQSLALLPQLQTIAHHPPTGESDDKYLFFARDIQMGQPTSHLPVKAIFLPHISPQEKSGLTPATHAEALAALAPSTVFQMAGHGAFVLAQLAQITRRLPAYHLHLGQDMAAPELIAECLGKLVA